MGFRPHAFKIVVALCCALLASSGAHATEWHVAPGGTGAGTQTSPFGRVQDALSSALPGDTIIVKAGTYRESLRTIRAGAPRAAITLRGESDAGPVVVTSPGTVLRIDHAYVAVENLVLDGQYGGAAAVDINSGADAFVLRRVEVRRAGRDCIDIGTVDGGLIEASLVHHCLRWSGGRSDAHGITASAVRALTVRDTEIHTFSGDGIQVDPGRQAPGWDSILVEGARIWLAPLERAENGFPAGSVPGENALDTKTPETGPRSRLIIRRTSAWGFRGAIENQAAFNLKENVDVLADGVTVWNSEIAFRLRGPTSRPGAWVALQNSVIHDVDVAVRYEDDIEKVRIWNSTFGANVRRAFLAASSGSGGVDVRNLLVLGTSLPREAVDRSNLTVERGAFVDAGTHDYRLAVGSPAVDAGLRLDTVAIDADGTARPQGAAYDVGAYEWHTPALRANPGPVMRPLRPEPSPAGSR
jgi:hypothetical protein